MEQKKLSHHENLLGTNNLVVRQNRFDSEGIFHAEFDGKKFKIQNYSLFGLGILSEEKLAEGANLDFVEIKCGNQHIVSLPFLVKRVKRADFGFEVGLEVVNGALPVETIMRIKDFNAVVSGLAEKENYYKDLPVEYKTTLLELVTRLEVYEKYVKSFSEKEFNNSIEFHESRESLIEVVSGQIKIELDIALERMTKGFKQEKSEYFKPAFAYFRDHMGKYIFQSPLTKRSYEKPRGYSGDFVMMTQIYANDNFANNLFGSCMEKAIQQFGEPSAVRNRSIYLAKKIVRKIKSAETDLKFLSVASGPAEEIKVAISELSQEDLSRCEFTLLDQDEGALQFAQKSILEFAMSQNKKVKLKLVNQGIKEILIHGLSSSKYDMIYSAGLFDYFTDAVATRACKVLGKHLGTRGELVIGNFNIETTNMFGMLAFFDWSLILRGEEDFKRLFNIEGTKMTVESEQNRINLFCCITF